MQKLCYLSSPFPSLRALNKGIKWQNCTSGNWRSSWWHREENQKHNLSGSLRLVWTPSPNPKNHPCTTFWAILVTNKTYIQMCREAVLIGRGHNGVFCLIEVFLEQYLAMELISKHWCLQYIFTKVKCLTMKHWAISVPAWAGVEQIPQASCLFILIMCQGKALSFH